MDCPIFVISDLHMSDGGINDEFAVGTGKDQLEPFLAYVAQHQGDLVVLGDLFKFGESNPNTVIALSTPWLNRFAALSATYVVGNHDAILEHLTDSDVLAHPFFRKMSDPFERQIGDKLFKFMHGHEVDPCRKPLLIKQLSTAQKWEWRSRIIGLYCQDKEANGYDIAIVGHTHRPGRIGNWYFNSGTWAGERNSFVQISPAGDVAVLDWVDGRPQPNPTVLETT
jgi:UDP-2,3-diacylglucosamine pyrophosphatase LpxH